MPPDPPRSSHLRRSYLITPLNKYCCQYEHPSKHLSYGPGLDQWRGRKYRNRVRAQSHLSPLVTNRLNSLRDAAVFSNPKLLHIAQDFIDRNLGPIFVSVHVRAERILSTFKNITAVVKCLSNLVKQVERHKKDIKASMPIFLAADFADYGSSSKQVKPARENAESLMKF